MQNLTHFYDSIPKNNFDLILILKHTWFYNRNNKIGEQN
jgi:hypothetical protein